MKYNYIYEIFLTDYFFISIIHIRYTFFIICYDFFELFVTLNFVIDIVYDLLIDKFKNIIEIKRDNFLSIEIANNFLIKNYIDKNYLK